MTTYPIYLMIVLLAVILPFLSAFVWYILLGFLLPGFPKIIGKVLFLKNKERWKKDASLSFSQILVHLSILVSIPASAVMEVLFIVPIVLVLGVESGLAQTLGVASAGPIEEVMKLLSAIVVYLIILLTHGGLRKGYDKVKVGIIAGIFSGAVFGLVESIGYLSIALEEIIINGPTLQYMDAFFWRVILGVSVHAVYTGVASGGIGRDGWSGKVKITSILLFISIIFHTMNNGIQGFFFLILEMEDALGYILVDIIQGSMVLASLVILALVWRGVIFGEKSFFSHIRGTGEK